LTNRVVKNKNNSVNFSAKYGYDAKGNLVKFEETYGGKFRAIEMTYDAFDRLTD